MKKTMMTRINSLVALTVMGAAFVACSSDSDRVEQISQQPQPNESYSLSIFATKGGSGVTRALELTNPGASEYISATWATTENIYVKNGENWCVSSLKPQTAGNSVQLKGFIKGTEFSTAEGHNSLMFYFPQKTDSYSYLKQDGTLTTIAEKFDYAVAGPVTITGIDENKVVTLDKSSITFTNQQAIIKFILLDKDNSDAAISPSALTVTDGTSTASLTDIPVATYTANGEGVLYVAFPATGTAETITLTATVGGNTYTYEKSDVTFTNGKYYSIEVMMNPGEPSGEQI